MNQKAKGIICIMFGIVLLMYGVGYMENLLDPFIGFGNLLMYTILAFVGSAIMLYMGYVLLGKSKTMP